MGGFLSKIKAAAAIISPIISVVQQILGFFLATRPFTPPHAEQNREEFPRPAWLSRDRFNFAVCGGQGGGKSSFVNFVRGIQNGAPGAAATGTGENHIGADGRAQRPIAYTIPNMPTVTLYDCAGLHTPANPVDEGVRNFGLAHMHFVVIVLGPQQTSTTYGLMRLCDSRNIPYFVINAHMDKCIEGEQYDSIDDDNERDRRATEDKHAEIAANMRDFGVGATRRRTFCVSFANERRRGGMGRVWTHAERFETQAMLEAFLAELRSQRDS